MSKSVEITENHVVFSETGDGELLANSSSPKYGGDKETHVIAKAIVFYNLDSTISPRCEFLLENNRNRNIF